MKKNTLWICLGVISAIIISLIVLQISYIERTVKLLNNSFDNNIESILYRINEQLEAEEIRYYADSLVGLPAYNRNLEEEGNPLSLDELNINTDTFKTIKLAPPQSSSLSEIIRQKQDENQKSFLHNQSLLNIVIFKVISETPNRPINKRINLASLNLMMEEGLREFHITLPYYFIIKEKRTNKIVYSHTSFECNDTSVLSHYTLRYSQPLFPRDRGGESHVLTLCFRPLALAKSVHELITPIFASTLLLLLVTIIAIVYMVKQRKLSQIKTDFTNNMTHELKTPVTNISLATEMLRDTSLNLSEEKRSLFLDNIHEETRRLKMLIDRTLETAVLDSKKAFLRMKEENVNSLISNAVKTFSFKVEHSNGKIITRLEADNAWCMVDKSHFENMIINLMENAVKYSREQLLITISTHNDANNNLIVTVADNGIGIKKEHLKHIFNRYYRVPTGNVHDVKGYGLGLAYVKRIVEGHHAQIGVTSEYGLGTTFTITISTINKTE